MPKKLVTMVLPIIGAPALVFAQGTTNQLCTILQNLTALLDVFGKVIFVLAIAVILWAAFLFITGSGGEEGATKARNYLIYALVGLAVALLAIFADDIVIQLFGTGQGQPLFQRGCTNIVF